MRLAFLILAHEQPGHFRRLCQRLPGSLWAHVCARVDQAPFETPAVSFVTPRLSTHHGGWSLTLAMLALLRSARSAGPHDFYLFLSGRDYPIRPASELSNYLAHNLGRNFINFYPLGPGAVLEENVTRFHWPDALAGSAALARLASGVTRRWLPSRPFPAGLQAFRGSQWLVLCAETAEYVLATVESPFGATYCKFFENVWGSDEVFFHSLVLNSAHAPRCHLFAECSGAALRDEVVAHLHYIDWDPAREDPAILDERDFPRLAAHPGFFARKFCESRSGLLLERIDDCLLTR